MSNKVIKQLSNTRISEINKKMGNTDISSIADGTATGAISELGNSLIETGNTKNALQTENYGTYHVCGSGSTSWYGFAKEIFDYLNLDVNLQPCETSEFPRPAKRPHYSVMENNKICRYWKDALHDYLDLRIEG